MNNKKLAQLSKKKIFNSDIFLLELNSKSEKLVVYFNQEDVKKFSNSDIFEGGDYNKLYVKDSSNSWFNGTLNGVFQKDTEFFEELKSVVDCFDKKDISFIGSYMGGYAAILYGVVLNIKKVLALSPHFYIKSKYLEKLTETIEKQIVYKNLYKVLDTVKYETKITIYTGSEQLINIYHLKEIDRYTDIKTSIIYSVDKEIITYLSSNNMIKKLIRSWLSDKKRFPIFPIFNLLDDKSGLEIIEDFIKNYALGKYKNARVSLDELIKRYPFWLTLYILDTHLHEKLNSSKLDIKKAYERIVELNPNNLIANMKLSQIFHNEKDYFYAALYSQKVLDISSNSREKYLIRSSIAFRNLHEYKKSIEAIHESFKINPNSFATIFQYGRILSAKELYIPALQSYKMALKIKPRHKQTMEEIKKIESVIYSKVKDIYSLGLSCVISLNRELNKNYLNNGIKSILHDSISLYRQSDISILNFSFDGKYEYKDIKSSSLFLKEINPSFLVIQKSVLGDKTKKLLTEKIYDFNILGIDLSDGNIQASYINFNGKRVALITIDITKEINPDNRSVVVKIKNAYDRVKKEISIVMLHIQWNKGYIDSSFKQIENILKKSVDHGYSAVFSNANNKNKIVEIYKNKAIIYDYSYMNLDNKNRSLSVFFKLYIFENSTVGIDIIPLEIGKNYVKFAKGNLAQKIKNQIKQRSTRVNFVEYMDRLYFY